MLYLKLKVGDFFAFANNQASFGRHLVSPLKTLWWDINNTLTFFQNGEWLKATVFILALLALAVSLYLLSKYYKQLRFSYLLFAGFSIFLPLCTGTTTSLGRYLLSAFPVFIAASLVKNRVFKYAWLSLGFLALLGFTWSFVAWYFVV